MSADLKTTKDSLVTALFELSKAANKAAGATVDYFNEAQKGNSELNSTELVADLKSAFTVLTAAASSIKTNAGDHVLETTDEPEGPPAKKKRVVDPLAPKKPLTCFLAFSSYCRQILKAERKKLGLPPLESQDMTKETSYRWNNMPTEEKQKWKDLYDEQMTVYNSEKEQYSTSKNEGKQIDMSTVSHPYVFQSVISPYTQDELASAAKTEKPEVSSEKKKEKKDKKKKKEKKEKKEKKHVNADASLEL